MLHSTTCGTRKSRLAGWPIQHSRLLSLVASAWISNEGILRTMLHKLLPDEKLKLPNHRPLALYGGARLGGSRRSPEAISCTSSAVGNTSNLDPNVSGKPQQFPREFSRLEPKWPPRIPPRRWHLRTLESQRTTAQHFFDHGRITKMNAVADLSAVGRHKRETTDQPRQETWSMSRKE